MRFLWNKQTKTWTWSCFSASFLYFVFRLFNLLHLLLLLCRPRIHLPALLQWLVSPQVLKVSETIYSLGKWVLDFQLYGFQYVQITRYGFLRWTYHQISNFESLAVYRIWIWQLNENLEFGAFNTQKTIWTWKKSHLFLASSNVAHSSLYCPIFNSSDVVRDFEIWNRFFSSNFAVVLEDASPFHFKRLSYCNLQELEYQPKTTKWILRRKWLLR